MTSLQSFSLPALFMTALAVAACSKPGPKNVEPTVVDATPRPAPTGTDDPLASSPPSTASAAPSSAPTASATTATRAPGPIEKSTTQPGVTFEGEGGLTCETSIIVHAKDERTGVASEYEWLKKHYPGAKMGTQALSKCGSHHADVMEVTTKDGKALTIYFDIEEYFGK